MYFRSLFVFLFASLVFTSAHAATNSGYWLGLFGKSQMDDKSYLWHEFQLRKNTDLGITEQSLVRLGWLYKLNEAHELGLLYAFIRTGASTEHRLTQQYSYSSTWGFSSRWRLEQRTLEKTNGVNLRLRALVRYQHTLFSKTSVVLWDELFYHLARPSWVYDDGFDRNRAFIGLRSDFSKVALEYGYLNQYANRAGSDINQHLAVVYLFYK